jgi:hypothetical protein
MRRSLCGHEHSGTKQGVEKLAVTPADAGVQCCEINKINGFWIPACAVMTNF